MENDESAQRLKEIICLYRDEGRSIATIARRFNVSRQAIHDRLKRAGAISRSLGRRQRKLDRETLVRLYLTEQLPVYKIARALKTGFKTIIREMDQHSIERRPKNYERRIPTEFDDLKVGESALIPYKSERIPYGNIYLAAQVRCIKVSVRRFEPGLARVTRVE